jgi:hypothetical protein
MHNDQLLVIRRVAGEEPADASIIWRSRIDDVELDPVQESVVMDGTGVGGSRAEGFEV